MEKIARTFQNSNHKFTFEFVNYYPRLKDWYLTAEPETYQWLLNNVKDNWNCIEVGAHIGETSMLLSCLAQRVIAFEPCHETAEMFMKNVAHNASLENEFFNIEFHERPVGNVDGVMAETLWLAGQDDKFGETHGEFDFTTLDSFYVKRPDIGNVNLLFIDADGWDMDVIEGAGFMIGLCRPYIIMEANYALQWRGHSFKNIADFMDNYKYDCMSLDAQCPGNLLLSSRKGE